MNASSHTTAGPGGQEMPAQIGGFKLVGRLGSGTMGQVFKAIQVSMDRPVALKVIPHHLAKNSFFTGRFVAEARAAGKLVHPHVVGCYDVGQADGYMYMALEYVGGGDAARLAKQHGGRLPERRALEIVRDCAAGLQAIHAAGLIHRDIKPANILLSERGLAKLGDLGLARGAGDDDGAIKHGGTVGTPAYISPEQAGGAELDIRSDIYSLCATLFKLLTGEAPFTGDSVWAVVARVINETVPDPRSLDPGVSARAAAIIRKGTAKEAADRYADPNELRADLELAIAGKDPLAMAQPKRARPQAPAQRTAGAKPPGPPGAAKASAHERHERAERPDRKATRQRPTGRRRLRVALVAGGALAALAVLGYGFSIALANRKLVEERDAKRQEVIAAGLAIQAKAPEVAPTAKPAPAAKPTPAAKPAPRKAAPPADTGPDPDVELAAKALMALPPEQQIKQLVEELRQINTDYDSQIDYLAEDGQIVELTLSTVTLSRIGPLAKLKQLRTLRCRGERQELKGNLDNLAPLRFLPLTTLDVSNNTILDLGPLAKLPLKRLECRNNLVRSVAPLRGLPLERLDLAGTFITDLAPLSRLPLKLLDLSRTPVTDLAPLKSLALDELVLADAKVSDLSPLKGMALKRLSVQGSGAVDLGPVAALPLRSLVFTPESTTAGLAEIRAMRSLEWLDAVPGNEPRPPAEFWQRFDQGEFSAKVRGEDPVAAGALGSVLANGDFEAVIGQRQVGWIIEAPGGVAAEEGNHFLRLSSAAATSTTTAHRQLILDPAWKTLAISVRMRATGLRPGKETIHAGRLVCSFVDEHGNRLGPWLPVAHLDTDLAWTRFDYPAVIPGRARRLELDCQLYQAAGSVDFDDVTIVPNPK